LKSNFRTLFAFVLPLLAFVTVAAQTHRASLRGTIYDMNGAAVPGVTVNLTSVATGETRTVTSGNAGEYAVSSVPPGLYQLEAEKSGFKKHSQRLELLVNEDRRR
jgi:protocatechuate 3,4-dioxygenase beta subunit